MYGLYSRLKATGGQNDVSTRSRHACRSQPLFVHGGPLSPGPLGAIQNIIPSIVLSKATIFWPSVKSHCMTKSHLVFT